MGRIGLTDLQPNTFRLGNQSVGKTLNMREYASQIITVNCGGPCARKNNNDDEGIALLLTIALAIILTRGWKEVVQLIL